MPGGLIALLDDVAALARLAAASADDVAAAASRASGKTVAVLVDDAAVLPGYVLGLPPQRELPVIWKIAVGSLRNKLLLVLPVALLLSRFLPWALTPVLMMGGLYLCFEGAEKILAAVQGKEPGNAVAQVRDAAELEARQVNSAVRTDLILSTEIMVITLNDLYGKGLVMQAGVLLLVGLAVTIGVYGVVALLVKMDDAGRWLAQKDGAAAASGRALVWLMPALLKTLSVVGTAAMLWVGGGILIHGLAHFGANQAEELVHTITRAISSKGAIAWIVTALCNGLAGVLAGSAVVGALHLGSARKA